MDNIAGVKQAVDGIDADTLTVLAQSPDGFAVLGGDDAYLLPMTLMGAPGAISASANLCTERFHGRGDSRAGGSPRLRAYALTLQVGSPPSTALCG